MDDILTRKQAAALLEGDCEEDLIALGINLNQGEENEKCSNVRTK